MSCLTELCGKQVTQATFTGSAVEFSLGESTLVLYLPLCIRSGEFATCFPARATLPPLQEARGAKVTSVEVAPGVSVRVELDNAMSIGIPLSHRDGAVAIRCQLCPGEPVEEY